MINSDNELHKAANSGDLETCKILLQMVDEEGNKVYSVNDCGAGGRTPFHRSAGSLPLNLLCRRYFIIFY